MSKAELDFGILDEVALPPQTLEDMIAENATLIAAEVARQTKIVTDIDAHRAVSGGNVVTFGDDTVDAQVLIRRQAFMKVLGGFGLEEAYYAPDASPHGTIEYDEGGYEIDLTRPTGEGTFRIVYVNDSKPKKDSPTPIGRQTVFYKRGT